MHYLLIYDVVSDYVTRRVPLRAAHLAHARAAVDRGELVLGGALANPADGAVLLFRSDSPEAAETFARADPYVLGSLVTGWRVREWTTVVGRDAEVSLPATEP
jgi:uncharacterized protein YciI